MRDNALIVVGASAGGLEALEALVGGLPGGLRAAVCVVLHIGDRPSAAPSILDRAGPLPASHATDREALRCGRIYVAPPGCHLVVELSGRLCLSRGPRENGTRPAVDPLFRSAARACGPAVIGVVLSGALNDGTAGLAEIKRRGGVAVVQDPADAWYPGMPRSALDHLAVDHCVPAAAMGALLVRLVAERDADATPPAASKETPMEGIYDLNRPAALTCPDCGGALRETRVDTLPYFTCHIGHRYGADSMEEAQLHRMEQAFEVALRALNERAALCRRLAETAQGMGQALSAKRWDEAGREAHERAEVLIRFLGEEWIRPPFHPGRGGAPDRF
ncbi:two-component system chemotaxis response regulator CheB [Azospirillum brasilense]|uniref:protein-glutamate methylesterase n=1 Tax=Azospirillum brasilense TaxID=192 RepID=A0A560BT20_AZOBR|nr:chemotaxis protein CheB [Azospirillum brasilense]TWA75659.1 two-component system chemotaxis response regulator CheB [Azospirillum brasilense]